MTALHLVLQPYDASDHGDQLRARAQQLTDGTAYEADRSTRTKAARQLEDYAMLLEHAEAQGWWDR